MRLKEFDLDLPYAPKDERNAFGNTTRCVTALYERCFPALDVTGAWKILVECVAEVRRREVLNLLGVLAVEVVFDEPSFQRANSVGRKQIALDVLHSGVLRVAELRGWPMAAFETARRGVIEAAYVNEWEWPKRPVRSPNRKRRAVLHCVHESDRFRAWLVVEQGKNEEVVRELVVEELPSEFLFVPKLGKLTWVSDDRLVLVGRNGIEVASVQV